MRILHSILAIWMLFYAAFMPGYVYAQALPRSPDVGLRYNVPGRQIFVSGGSIAANSPAFGRAFKSAAAGVNVVDGFMFNAGTKSVAANASRFLARDAILGTARVLGGPVVGTALMFAAQAAYCRYSVGSFQLECETQQMPSPNNEFSVGTAPKHKQGPSLPDVAVAAAYLVRPMQEGTCTLPAGAGATCSIRYTYLADPPVYTNPDKLLGTILVKYKEDRFSYNTDRMAFVATAVGANMSYNLPFAVIYGGKTCAAGTLRVDGTCSSGEFEAVKSEPEAIAKLSPHIRDIDLPQIAEDISATGRDLAPYSEPVKVNGPALVELAPVAQTKNYPDGSKDVLHTTNRYDISYAGDTINYNNTTVTTTTHYDPSGVPTSTTTEDTNPVQPEPEKPPEEEPAPATDPAMPAQPNLYTRKYEGGIAEIWANRVASIQSTPIFNYLSSLNPNLGSGGCPTWAFNGGSVLGINAAGDMSIPCYVWTAIKSFITITALLTARRLIFGG